MQDTMKSYHIMKGISGLYTMFVNMMFIGSCKLRNQSISFLHMIGLVVSLTMGIGKSLFVKNHFLRKR